MMKAVAYMDIKLSADVDMMRVPVENEQESVPSPSRTGTTKAFQRTFAIAHEVDKCLEIMGEEKITIPP